MIRALAAKVLETKDEANEVGLSAPLVGDARPSGIDHLFGRLFVDGQCADGRDRTPVAGNGRGTRLVSIAA